MQYERMQLLATVAELYYVERQSQAQIAEQTGYSRSAISRLITEAHENGIVEVKINHPLQRASDLEQRLMKQFDLSVAYVAQRGGLDHSRMLRLLGRLGAHYLSESLQPTSILGISWGTAVYEVGQALRPRNYPDMRVIQMIGAVGDSNSEIDGHEVARAISSTFGGSYHTLNAPLIVEDPVTKNALLNDNIIQRTIDLAYRSDFALVGIGSNEPDQSSLLRAGHLKPNEVDELNRAGAVGDICACIYDIEGKLVEHPLNERVVGIDIHKLANTDCKIIGVAGGEVKAPAILGALRGKLIDGLITDSTAAETFLTLSEN